MCTFKDLTSRLATDGERNVVNNAWVKNPFIDAPPNVHAIVEETGNSLILPCIATHPNVTLSLIGFNRGFNRTDVTKNNLYKFM